MSNVAYIKGFIKQAALGNLSGTVTRLASRNAKLRPVMRGMINEAKELNPGMKIRKGVDPAYQPGGGEGFWRQPARIEAPSLLHPSTGHELGHALTVPGKPEDYSGDRSILTGLLGGPVKKSRLPSEADATNAFLSRVRARNDPALFNDVSPSLTSAYDTYRTAELPSDRMFNIGVVGSKLNPSLGDYPNPRYSGLGKGTSVSDTILTRPPAVQKGLAEAAVLHSQREIAKNFPTLSPEDRATLRRELMDTVRETRRVFGADASKAYRQRIGTLVRTPESVTVPEEVAPFLRTMDTWLEREKLRSKLPHMRTGGYSSRKGEYYGPTENIKKQIEPIVARRPATNSAQQEARDAAIERITKSHVEYTPAHMVDAAGKVIPGRTRRIGLAGLPEPKPVDPTRIQAAYRELQSRLSTASEQARPHIEAAMAKLKGGMSAAGTQAQSAMDKLKTFWGRRSAK